MNGNIIFISTLIFFSVVYLLVAIYIKFKHFNKIDDQIYPPYDLTPGEISVLVYKKYDKHHIASDIINLAGRGHLKIQETEKSIKENLTLPINKNFKLIRIENENNDLKRYEKKIINLLFNDRNEISLTDLGGTMSKYYYSNNKSEISDIVENDIEELRKQDLTRYEKYLIPIAWIIFEYIYPKLIKGDPFHNEDFLNYLISSNFLFGISFSFAIAIPFIYLINNKLREKSEVFVKINSFRKNVIKIKNNDSAYINMYFPYSIIYGVENSWSKKMTDIKKYNFYNRHGILINNIDEFFEFQKNFIKSSKNIFKS